MTPAARDRLGRYAYEEHASITQAVLTWGELRPEDRGAWVVTAVALAGFVAGRFEAAGVAPEVVERALDGLGEVADGGQGTQAPSVIDAGSTSLGPPGAYRVKRSE